MTAQGANLGRRWPAALLDSKATDGIVIARETSGKGEPQGAEEGLDQTPRKGPAGQAFSGFHFPRLRELKRGR